MFERLLNIVKRQKRPSVAAKSSFMRPKGEPVKTPTVVSSDRKAPAPVTIQDVMPPALLVQDTQKVTIPASEPFVSTGTIVPLPPDIDPSQVIVVKHDAKKVDGERFKYVDKPLKPLYGSDRKPDVIKYNDTKGGEVIKYKAAPASVRPKEDRHEKPAGDVIKYTPVRVEIKN